MSEIVVALINLVGKALFAVLLFIGGMVGVFVIWVFPAIVTHPFLVAILLVVVAGLVATVARK
jgi:membrane protein DedA with SNARE-associated domain